MGTAIALNKILALLVGPAGYAAIGQFQNLLSVVVTFATGAINTGVTKATAEYHNDRARQLRLWRTATTIIVITSLISALFITLFSRQLAQLFLGSADYKMVIVWAAISIFPISFNALLLAILTGLKEVRRYVVSNIAGSVIALLVTGILAWYQGLEGALIALSLNQAVVIIVTLLQIRKCEWFQPKLWIGTIDRTELKGLSGYTLMAGTTALVGPTSLLLVRNILIERFGLSFAGYWDAMWRISTIYLTLITTTLTLYYLPRIAELRDWDELRSELWHVLRLVVPTVILVALGIFVTRDLTIPLLFSKSFAPMKDLFAWQLFGDVLKVTAWLFAFMMVGRGLTIAFIVTEIMANVIFVLGTFILTAWFGFGGVAMAHCLNYAIYLIVVVGVTIGTPSRRARLLEGKS